MADDLHLKIISTADSKGFADAAKDLKDTRAEADKLGKSFDDAGDHAGLFERDVEPLSKSISDQANRVKALRAEHDKLNRERGAPMVTGVLQDMFGGMKGIGGAPPQAIAGIAALGVALAPPLAGAISGAILGAAGTGGVIGGALLAAKDPQVKSAWAQLGRDLMDELEPAGQAFVGPVVEAADILRDAFKGSNIAEELKSAAVLVEPLAKGIGGFVEMMGPGLGDAFRGSKPVFDMLSKELPQLGDAVGDAFSSMAAVGPEAAKGLKDVFDVTELGIRTMADAAAGLTVLNTALGGFTGLLANADPDAMSAVLFGPLGTLGAVYRHTGQSAKDMAEETKRTQEVLLAETVAVQTAERKTRDLANAQAQAALSARDLKAAWDELHGRQMTLDEGFKRAYDGLEQVKNAFKGADDSVEGNSQASVARRLALEQEAGIAVELAQSYLDMTGDAKGAQKILDDFKASAEKATGATGEARKKVDALADALFKLPPKREVYVTTYIRTVEGNFRADERGTLNATGYATRATGGPAKEGQPLIVGDGGRPELFVPQSDGYIYPSVPRGGGMGFGNGAVPLVVNIYGDMSGDEMMEKLRNQIAARGGTLAVLGLRS